MKSKSFILKFSCVALWVMTLICGPLNCTYASKEEVLDLEEEKSDIEDRMEECHARGKSYTNTCFE